MRKWVVDLTLIEAWIDSLDDEEYDNPIAALEQLEEHGPVTRRPFVDTLEGSAHPNMKELRPRTTKGGAHIRVLFAFDIQGRAIVLVAGDKAGNWTKWYVTSIPVADRLFAEHQEKIKQADAAKAAKPKTRKGKKRRPRSMICVAVRARIDAIKGEMDREVGQYRLRELREDAGYTQTSLAAAIGVGQNRVSQMEHGNLGTSRVDTLRKYVEATGGELEVAVKCPDGSRVLLSL